MSSLTARALHSLVTSDGRLKLSIDEAPVPVPGADEVVVRIDAAPLNPSDIGTLLGQAVEDILMVQKYATILS